MKEIVLSNGMVTVLDDEDYGRFVSRTWYAKEGRRGSFYAASYDEKFRTRQMQRWIMDPERILPRSIVVDHISGDTLDNRRCNLRLVDMVTSNINRKLFSNNKTGYRGVTINSRYGGYSAGIKIAGKSYNLGRYQTAEEAALAYNQRALAIRGPEARLNVLLPTFTDADT